MKMPTVQHPPKADIEARQYHKREKEIKRDIQKIEEALQSANISEMQSLHKYLDGKYQCCIADWGKSMYGYINGHGFNYEWLNDEASLKDNLSTMKPKLEAFIHGWNTKGHPSNYARNSDVNVTVNTNVNVNITFEQAREKIENMTSLTDDQTKDALDKVSEIEAVVNGEGSKKFKWEKIKPILTWLADKSFDVAMTILPLLLQVQG